jgi:hypothetical protein
LANPLDDYLNRVARCLREMPEVERDAEMQEVRGHLEALVETYSARGMDADAAMREATRQFGSARKVGEETLAAWRRPDKPDPGSVWLATGVCLTWTLAWQMLLLLMQIVGVMTIGIHHFYNVDNPLWRVIPYLMYVPAGLSGWMAGAVAPRYGLIGTALVYTAMRVCASTESFTPRHIADAGLPVLLLGRFEDLPWLTHQPGIAYIKPTATWLLVGLIGAAAARLWIHHRRYVLYMDKASKNDGGAIHG